MSSREPTFFQRITFGMAVDRLFLPGFLGVLGFQGGWYGICNSLLFVRGYLWLAAEPKIANDEDLL